MPREVTCFFVLCATLLDTVLGSVPGSTCVGEPDRGDVMLQTAAGEIHVKDLGDKSDRSASVTKQDLEDALETTGCSKDQASNHADALTGQLFSKVEVAMFLGQAFHESGGLVYAEESDSDTDAIKSEYDWGGCDETECTSTDSCDKKSDDNGNSWRGKGCGNCCSHHYHGRGFLQLTWEKNYESYGHATDPEYAKNNPIHSAIWFWKNFVRPCAGCWDGKTVDYWPTVKTSSITKAEAGRATMAINPSLECPQSGATVDCAHKNKARHRFQNFKEIAEEWNLGTPTEDSTCYDPGTDFNDC